MKIDFSHVVDDVILASVHEPQILLISSMNYDSFTPITISLPEVSGVEPDFCFCIENWRSVVGKSRIDWQTDPPPDLVIEIDVTSYTNINDYLVYKVPEVWMLRNKQFLVYRLQEENYTLGESSYFHNVSEFVQQCFQIASEQTTSEAIRWLRKFLVSTEK